MTFDHPLYYMFRIDTEVGKGYSSDVNAMKNLMPAKVNREQLNDAMLSTHSTTDNYGKTVDPGNTRTRVIYYQNLKPRSWQ